MPKLTRKNKLFVDNFTNIGNLETFNNASQSAIKSGYSPKSASSIARDLLQKPQIKDAIAKKESEIAGIVNISKDSYLGLVYDSYRTFKQESCKVKLLEIIGRAKNYLDPAPQKQQPLFNILTLGNQNNQFINTPAISPEKEHIEINTTQLNHPLNTSNRLDAKEFPAQTLASHASSPEILGQDSVNNTIAPIHNTNDCNEMQ